MKRTFVNWLIHEAVKGRYLIGLTTILGWFFTLSLFLYGKLSLTLTTEEFDKILKTQEGIRYRSGLAIIHAATCFLLAVMTPRPKVNKLNENQADIYITTKASERIHTMVISLYLSLFLLYGVIAFFTFKASPDQAVIFPDPSETWGAVFEVLTATLIFFLYVELSAITVESEENLSSPTDENQAALERSASDARRHKLLFVGFALGLAVLSILSFYFPSHTGQMIVRVIVACLSGVTLAMVVGRLGSLYINPGTATLFLLYLYAVIQSFAAFFPRPTIIFIVTGVALPLKVLLWFVFVWAFTSGKLWEYVQEIRDILERQNEKHH